MRFTVSDTGIGISDDQLGIIFEPFVQGEAGIRRLQGGAGLGLTLVKRFTELLDGTLTIESEPGRGAAIHVVIPFGVVQEKGLPPDKAPAGPVTQAKTGRRVLVVEDDAINRMAVVTMLGKLGYEAMEAADASEALKLLTGEWFDCVLMDVQLPGASGVEAARMIRSAPIKNPDVPIVACTAHAMTGDREKFLSQGMSEYLSKPLTMEDLAAMLKKVFGGGGRDSA